MYIYKMIKYIVNLFNKLCNGNKQIAYITRIGEIYVENKKKYFRWLNKSNIINIELCRDFLLKQKKNSSSKYIIEYFYNDVFEENILYMKVATYEQIMDKTFEDTFDIDKNKKISSAYITDGNKSYDVTNIINSYYLPINNLVKVKEIVYNNGQFVIPKDYTLYIKKDNQVFQYFYGNVLYNI
jgi:hypothetical protein